MNGAGRRKADVVLAGAVVLAITAGMTWFPAPRAFAAQRVALALAYTCAFPEIGDQSASVNVESDIPNSIAVGQSTAHYVVTASATVPWELAVGLRAFGVSTITGTVEGQAGVEAPQGDFAETVPFGVPKTTVPAFSSFTADAIGSAPAVTFAMPGTGEITVGNFLLHLVPRDSSGNLTPLGEPSVPCTLDPGQNDVAASFAITGAAKEASSGPATEPATRSSSPVPSASSSMSVKHPAVSRSESVRTAATGSSSSGDTGWVIWLGGLAALVAIGVAAFRIEVRRDHSWLKRCR
jgi:hypothetical protein